MAGRGTLSGLRAAQSYAQSNASKPHPSYASPLLGQYSQWTMGRQSQANALPRDPLAFLTGAFGPLRPIDPIGVDQPDQGDDRPMLRRWQYPVAWNMPVGTPGSEGLKLADFGTLRLYAEIYSVARACIQLRKDELLGVGWDIGPTHDASKAMRGDSGKRKDFGERRAELLRFFRRPDPDYNDFTTWLEAVLEDVFVIDALSIYLHPSRVPGKGVLGSDLAGLDLIAGDTIRPLLDLRGGSPAPPNPAYQQYLYGVPRTDLMTILTGDDLKEMDAPVHEYRGDQLLYLPRNPRSWTPYGQAPMERCIVPVITGLRRQQYQMDYYLEGSIPGMFISPGDPDMTPNQIRELQDTLNALAGDQAWKHKIIVLPAGSKTDPQKPPTLSDQTDEMLMTEVLMAYSVMPMELGILPRVSSVQSPSMLKMAEQSQDVQERKTLKPDLLWLKNALFDRIIQGVCGQHDMEWRWDGLEEDKDEMTMTQLLTQQISFGLTSIDEGRIEIGRDPWGLEVTQDPGWATAAGFMPLEAINPDTGMPNVEVAQGHAPNGVPAIPGSPAGSSRGGGLRQGGAASNAAPATPASAPPSKPAANQRRRTQSNAHDAAAAAEAHAAAKPAPVRKAAFAELDSLCRHLNKGRLITTWEPRYLDNGIIAKMSEDLAHGLELDIARAYAASRIKMAEETSDPDPGSDIGPSFDDHGGVYNQWERSLYGGQNSSVQSSIPSGGGSKKPGGKKPQVRKGVSMADRIRKQLSEDYPDKSMGWLDDVDWVGPVSVPLKDIDTSGKKTWNAWEEPKRVAQIESEIRRKKAKGTHVKPAILIDSPDTPSQTHLIVIDGHHRTLASLKSGEPLWAFVGKTNRVKGPWLLFHTKQDREGGSTDEFADEPAKRKSA